jgi:peroxiredoxin/tetratricopeptide (TPR) repeat protein
MLIDTPSPTSIATPSRKLTVLLCFLLFVVTGVHLPAQNDAEKEKEDIEVLAGHSFHGEAFNEGPRQKAYLMGGTGNVDFPVTTKCKDAQAFFNQGIGQLHGFWYFEAERSFRQVALLDPDCAMAYWGMAMANVSNEKRAPGFIAEAVKRKEGVTPRERLWIEGLDEYIKGAKKNAKSAKQKFIKKLEQIIFEYPDDIEAKAFLVVRLWQFKRDLPISSHLAVDAILDQIFAANPMHPAHHYRIHLWDYEKPERAITSAARGGQSGPSIAHLWHMPGHTFSRLKRYGDAVWQQEASSRADHAHMIRDGVLPDQIHNYAHNQEWMIRNLINIGRSQDAIALASNLIDNPQHPKYNTLSQRGKSASYGRSRLFQVLEKFEMWDELIRLSNTMYLEPTDFETEQEQRLRALGVAYFNKGNFEKTVTHLVELQARLASARKEQSSAGTKAAADAKKEKKSNEDIEKAKVEAEKKFDSRIRFLNAGIAELTACSAILTGTTESAQTLLGETTAIAKDRLSRLYLRTGDKEKAEKFAAEAVKSAENQVLPLANQVHLLHTIGKTKEAKEAFLKLVDISAHIDDLNKPPFKRLKPIAKEFELPEDWRKELAVADDVGERPPLDSIGPLLYEPLPAKGWSLPNGDNQLISLKDYKGRPVIVIFYLGAGCLHCVEQLGTFAPMTQQFADAGISLVGISTDQVSGLKDSLNDFKVDGKFPFPLVSDHQLNIFKKYRAFDDFENQPLHGTFLIEQAGLVRWHDISYEPFAEAEFLLKEAKRLISRPQLQEVVTGSTTEAK